jgi:hypothetical protein
MQKQKKRTKSKSKSKKNKSISKVNNNCETYKAWEKKCKTCKRTFGFDNGSMPMCYDKYTPAKGHHNLDNTPANKW